MEKNMDKAKYFKKLNEKLDGRVLNSFVPCSSSSSAAREMNGVQEEQDCKKKRQVLPEKV